MGIIQDTINSSNVANVVNNAILEYKTKYKSKYDVISKYVDPTKLTFTIAKIEGNFSPKAFNPETEAKAKNSNVSPSRGLFQFQEATIKTTYLSMFKKDIKIDTAFIQSFVTDVRLQTLLELELQYITFVAIEKNGNKLNSIYESCLTEIKNELALDNQDINCVRYYLTHAQGIGAIYDKNASNSVILFYPFYFLGTYLYIKQFA